MPKVIFGVALVLFLGLVACAGIKGPQVRGVAAGPMPGVGGNGMLASNARPAMAVQPAEGSWPVAHGVLDTSISQDGAMPGGLSARVWYALHGVAGGSGQLAACLARLPGSHWQWSVNPRFTDHRGIQILRKHTLSRYGLELTALTYIRPADKDPWMPAFKAAARGWDGPLLVRQYAWWADMRIAKVLVEYREPVPENYREAYFEDETAYLQAFEARADASFRLLRKEQGDALPPNIERARGNEAGISPRLTAGILGEATLNMVPNLDD